MKTTVGKKSVVYFRLLGSQVLWERAGLISPSSVEALIVLPSDRNQAAKPARKLVLPGTNQGTNFLARRDGAAKASRSSKEEDNKKSLTTATTTTEEQSSTPGHDAAGELLVRKRTSSALSFLSRSEDGDRKMVEVDDAETEVDDDDNSNYSTLDRDREEENSSAGGTTWSELVDGTAEAEEEGESEEQDQDALGEVAEADSEELVGDAEEDDLHAADMEDQDESSSRVASDHDHPEEEANERTSGAAARTRKMADLLHGRTTDGVQLPDGASSSKIGAFVDIAQEEEELSTARRYHTEKRLMIRKRCCCRLVCRGGSGFLTLE